MISLTQNQVTTLKVYFGINRNPDANDLEQLEQKIGVRKRILQVWFQIARAKWRRKLSHQRGSVAAACGTVQSPNESLVAASVSTVSENASTFSRKELLRSEKGSYDSLPASSGGNQSYKTKRMTSLTQNQVTTLKVYFGINRNPDANDLEQLEQKIGVRKRILQVWFQIARAKWRRKLSHQRGSAAAACGTVQSPNESLVAASVSTVSENATSLPRQPNIDPPPYPFLRQPDIEPPPLTSLTITTNTL